MEDYTRNYVDGRVFEQGTDQDEKFHVSPLRHIAASLLSLANLVAQVDDFTLQKSDGTVIKGREESINGLKQIYGPFAGHKHVPDFLVCWETDDGYAMAGVANVYFKLHGLGEGTVDDPEGGKWHGACAGAFQFDYVKDGSDGFKLRKTRIFSDSSPALKVMLKNNMINADQLAGIVIGS